MALYEIIYTSLASRDLPPEELAQQIRRLRDEWRTLNRGAGEDPADELQQFQEAADRAYEPCREHFARQAEQRKQNQQQREALLERVSDEDDGIYARNAGQTDEVFRLRALSHPLQQAFERYYIAISVLVKNGPGTLGAAELESLCQQAAQRLSLLYAPAAPEFFDKTLFRGFIQKLRELKLVWPDENSKLLFDERLDAWARDAKAILGRELRHTIEKVSPEAARPAELPPAQD